MHVIRLVTTGGYPYLWEYIGVGADPCVCPEPVNNHINHGRPLPIPISYCEPKAIGCENITSVVDIDFDQYRSELDNRLVRKNLTIPYWMNVKAEKLGMNFSYVLREAVEEYIAEADSEEKKSQNEQSVNHLQ